MSVPAARATQAATFILDVLGVSLANVERLQEVPMDVLLGAYAKSLNAGFFRTFSPVLDGHGLSGDAFSPDAPIEATSVPPY